MFTKSMQKMIIIVRKIGARITIYRAEDSCNTKLNLVFVIYGLRWKINGVRSTSVSVSDCFSSVFVTGTP